ncbi:MAG: MBL fold metallo-hydrolase [Bacteroidia bacterium]|nr:MBL fold metallo-hydrolase [Bacteroidia bacterium]
MANFHTIETGYFWADGGAMFGPIPKKYWQKRYPCNDNNMCLMTMRCLFIETNGRKILVDCGAGDKQLDKLKYYQPHDLKDLRGEIEKIGYSADEITDVVLTHLHFDHCGGGTVFDEEKNIVPAFPNASYWLSRLQWENYKNPMLYEAASFFPENIEPVSEAGQLQLIDSDQSLCDNVTLKLYNGHTPGQIAVFFDNSDEKIIFPADVIPTSVHLPLGWLSAYDNNAALAMEEKKRFLDEAKAENATLVFFHDAYKAMETIS